MTWLGSQGEFISQGWSGFKTNEKRDEVLNLKRVVVSVRAERPPSLRVTLRRTDEWLRPRRFGVAGRSARRSPWEES